MDSLTASQHLIGNFEMSALDESFAQAQFEIQAMHQFKDEPGSPLRAAGAAYSISARRAGDGWSLATVLVRARWVDPGLAVLLAAFAARQGGAQ
jgi:hypothetical protein